MKSRFQTVVFLVRHGEPSPRNTTDPYSSAVDHPRSLTERGEAQARKVGQYLANYPIARLYSSPVQCCFQTAQIINQEGDLKLSVVTGKALTEVYPSEFALAKNRGETFLTRLVAEHAGKQLVCISHRFVIGSILAEYFNQKDWSEVSCEVASVYRLVFADHTLVEASYLTPAAGADK